MTSITAAITGILLSTVDVALVAPTYVHGAILDDDDQRYRLQITLAQESAVGGDAMPTILCLSPAIEDRVEVCLGEQNGYSFQIGSEHGVVLKLAPPGTPACRCERPFVLRADQPVCWSMDVWVPNVGNRQAKVAGFVTILEDVHGIGGTAESCINVHSNQVPFAIKSRNNDTNHTHRGSEIVRPQRPPADTTDTLRSATGAR